MVIADSLGLGQHSVYNAGLRAATIEDTRIWLENFVMPTMKPKEVILGLSDFGLADARCTLCIDRSVAADAWLGKAPAYAAFANRYSRTFRYRGTLRKPLVALDSTRTFDQENIENLDPDGYAPWESRVYSGDYMGALPPADFAAGSKVLEDLVVWLQAQDVRVVLVSMPVLKARDSPVYDKLVASWLSIANRHGATLVQPKLADYPAELFADEVHLNATGARRLSALIAQTKRNQ